MKKRILKLIITILVIIMMIFLIKYIYNSYIINKIGKKIVDTYSLNNIYYEYRNIGKNRESSIRKRLNKKIYYQTIVGEDEGATKQTYYSDNENELYYCIPDDEKILIEDSRAVMLFGQMDTQMARTRAEVYCYQKYLGLSNRAYNFVGLKNKEIDNIKCYEIIMKYDSFLEKTYFNKETLLPIKTIRESAKGNQIFLEWDITIKENIITEEEVKTPEGYTIMNLSEYLNYIKQKN